MKHRRILLCTDMDRTLLPNGHQPESPSAKQRFERLAARPEVRLAYVTGRHKAHVQEAIRTYGVPAPDYVLGDVGTTIYHIRGDAWEPWQSWEKIIAEDWGGLVNAEVAALFRDLKALKSQEPEKQNRFKVSYYLPHDYPTESLFEEMHGRLRERGISARLVWSVDETRPIGLLDIIPSSASKRHAIEFLMESRGFTLEDTIFAGDSGNDLPVLTSSIHAVLVANASDTVKQQALQLASEAGTAEALYLAHGDFLGMNGNYRGGILEGLAHYLPETRSWFE